MNTDEQQRLRQNAAAIIACAEGKPIQERSRTIRGKWLDINGQPAWSMWDRYEWRPAPEPVSRPWSKPEDVPGPVCWIRRQKGNVEMLIVAIHEEGMMLNDAGGRVPKEWSDISEHEHSTDRRTWLPCTVTEP